MSASSVGAELPAVLVVDDQPANLIAAGKILQKLPVRVVTASSGQEALAQLLRHEFAVILLDVRMPVMDGYETAALIRDHTAGNPVPIIFVTAEASEQHAVDVGYQSGAVDYLLKPIDEAQLLAKLRIFLELYRHRRELAEATRALRQGTQRLQRLLQAVGDGIVGVDADGRIGMANPAACRFLGCTPAQVVGQPVAELFEDGRAAELMAAARAGGAHRELKATLRRPGGGVLAAEFVLSAIDADAVGQAASYVLVFQDIGERLLAEGELRRQAQLDHLTGLANRLMLEQRLTSMLARASNRPFGLLLLDLNGFKSVNDTHGHAVGDFLLREVANRLRETVRAADLAARLGGDEFALVLEGVGDPVDAVATAEKLATVLSRPYPCGAFVLNIGASIGVASHPRDGDTVAALLQAADAAMYVAKRERRAVVLAGAGPSP